MNSTTFSPISFSSRIKFVSDEEFRNRTAGEARDYSNKCYIGAPWDEAIAGPVGLTEDIYGCNAGGLTNTVSKDAVTFHFKPIAATYSRAQFQDKIYQALSRLGGYTDRLGGLIIGGKSGRSGDCNISNSLKLSEKLENLFNDVKASVTKFWGQQSSGGKTNIFYSGNEDTWYVNYQDKNKDSDPNQIRTPQDIKDAYFDIEVSDNDQVFIGETYVDKFELKPQFKRIDNGYEMDMCFRNPLSQPQYQMYGDDYADRNKIQLYVGDYGRDRSTMWVEAKNINLIEQMLKSVDEIKESSMFSEVSKIHYAGETALQGFKPIAQLSEGKKVFELIL